MSETFNAIKAIKPCDTGGYSYFLYSMVTPGASLPTRREVRLHSGILH